MDEYYCRKRESWGVMAAFSNLREANHRVSMIESGTSVIID